MESKENNIFLKSPKISFHILKEKLFTGDLLLNTILEGTFNYQKGKVTINTGNINGCRAHRAAAINNPLVCHCYQHG